MKTGEVLGVILQKKREDVRGLSRCSDGTVAFGIRELVASLPVLKLQGVIEEDGFHEFGVTFRATRAY